MLSWNFGEVMLWRNHGEIANSFAAKGIPKLAARSRLLYSQVLLDCVFRSCRHREIRLKLAEAWWRLHTISGSEQGKRQKMGRGDEVKPILSAELGGVFLGMEIEWGFVYM